MSDMSLGFLNFNLLFQIRSDSLWASSSLLGLSRVIIASPPLPRWLWPVPCFCDLGASLWSSSPIWCMSMGLQHWRFWSLPCLSHSWLSARIGYRVQNVFDLSLFPTSKFWFQATTEVLRGHVRWICRSQDLSWQRSSSSTSLWRTYRHLQAQRFNHQM